MYIIDSIEVAPQNFQGRRTRLLEATAHDATSAFAGATLIRTAQPLGNLVVYLLEPESEDGFAAWDLFGERLEAGGTYPVIRIARPDDLVAKRTTENMNEAREPAATGGGN